MLEEGSSQGLLQGSRRGLVGTSRREIYGGGKFSQDSYKVQGGDQGEQAEGKSKEEEIRTPTRIKEGLVGTSRSSATKYERYF